MLFLACSFLGLTRINVMIVEIRHQDQSTTELPCHRIKAVLVLRTRESCRTRWFRTSPPCARRVLENLAAMQKECGRRWSTRGAAGVPDWNGAKARLRFCCRGDGCENRLAALEHITAGASLSLSRSGLHVWPVSQSFLQRERRLGAHSCADLMRRHVRSWRKLTPHSQLIRWPSGRCSKDFLQAVSARVVSTPRLHVCGCLARPRRGVSRSRHGLWWR
jgi:hypothetical protein